LAERNLGEGKGSFVLVTGHGHLLSPLT